jgi:glutamate 5-kinase
MQNIDFLDKCNKINLKIGSAGIIKDGYVDSERMKKYADDIIHLRGLGKKVYLTCSGAVETGKNVLQDYAQIETDAERQKFAAAGQPNLIHSWETVLIDHKLHAVQVLVDDEDLDSEVSLHKIDNVIEECWKNSCIPIVNYNEAKVAKKEEMVNTLASKLTYRLNHNLLIILADDFENIHYTAAKECNEHFIPVIMSKFQTKMYDILKGECDVYKDYPKDLFSGSDK